jgi:hypothetical protein
VKRSIQIAICLIWMVLVIGCAVDNSADKGLEPQATGSILGNISPITVTGAEVTLLQHGKVIAIVAVQDGFFEIDNLPPGTYQLRISAPDYTTNNAIKDIKVVAGETTDVDRAIIYPQDTGKYIPTRLIGTVFDADSGAPIAGASIRVECTEGICSILESISDSEGKFEVTIWADLASIVTVKKEAYQTAQIEVVGIPTSTAKLIEVGLEKRGE